MFDHNGPSINVPRSYKEMDAGIIASEADVAFLVRNKHASKYPDYETNRLRILSLLEDPYRGSYHKWWTAVRRSAISMAEEGRYLTELEFELRAERFLRDYP